MNFTPEDGFCCPYVEKWSLTSEYDPRISKFMAWVNSLPIKSGQYRVYALDATVAPLKDQPFVIKIVEDGYAFMFHGAFAPRIGEGDSGGFDRIPYFDLVTSDFEELRYAGEESEVVVCETHGKRFLLGLYLKASNIKEPHMEETSETTNGPQILETLCGESDRNDPPVADPGVIGNEDNDGGDEMVTGSTASSSRTASVNSFLELPPSVEYGSDTWTWL